MEKDLKQLCAGFSQLSRNERFERLLEMGVLEPSDVSLLKSGAVLDPELAEHWIENAIGYFQIPIGVAVNFRIDGEDFVIPMAVEETSIIAAASKTAKWVRDAGEIKTWTVGTLIIGQIQFPKVKDARRLCDLVEAHSPELMARGNEVAQGLVKRGGGVQKIETRIVSRGENAAGEKSTEQMVVLHVLADPVDAMGANIINQVCEALKEPLEKLTGESVGLCILSNLVDTRLTVAEIRIPNIDPKLAEGIEEASLFARQDPYRAATNNKGVLNGIDAVLVATGNDWRAVEAGVHAYAARTGQYRSITEWRYTNGELIGRIEAPIVVGTVGGVTALHPMAKLSLKMLNVTSSEKLSRIAAAVGLVQNLGALRALSTVGVVEGHMKLHTANLALAAGAQKEEVEYVQSALQEILARTRKVSLSEAVKVLKEIRSKKLKSFGASEDHDPAFLT